MEKKSLIEKIQDAYAPSKNDEFTLLGYNNALVKLSDDLYSKDTHFILELIQNAEDNNYDSVIPMIKFIIESDKIVIINNEVGFKGDNVRSICTVGDSTKAKKNGYIGEKGIGFKSVFKISNEPHIFSNGYNFKFVGTNGSNIEKHSGNLGYIYPYWINEIPDYVDLSKTNIILPLKEGANKVISGFDDINDVLLLFLKKLKEISIEDHISGKIRKLTKSENSGNICTIDNEVKKKWKIVRKYFDIPEAIRNKENSRKDCINVELILAFPLMEDNNADTGTRQNIFAFLPVDDYGFNFVIQGDFLLTANRESIHKDNNWNIFLRDRMADLFIDAVEEFKNDENLSISYYNFIPDKNQVKDSFFNELVDNILDKLRNAKCILTESGNWSVPANVFLASKDFRNLITNEEVKEVFGREFLSKEIIAESEILKNLGIEEFNYNRLVEFLKNTDLLNKKDKEWFAKLYIYLNSQNLNKDRIGELKSIPIIKLTNGQIISASQEKPIYFPLEKKEGYSFEKDLEICEINFSMPENESDIRKFLQKMGIKNAKPAKIIQDTILPIYKNNDKEKGWKSKSAEDLFDYVRYIKVHIGSLEPKEDSEEENEDYENDSLIEKIKETLYLKIATEDNNFQAKPTSSHLSIFYELEKFFSGRNGINFIYPDYNKYEQDRVDLKIATEDNNFYAKPTSIYLSNFYGCTNDIEELFSGINDINFIHSDYYKYEQARVEKKYQAKKKKSKKNIKIDKEKKKEELEKAKASWREFFLSIGVEDKPRTTKLQAYDLSSKRSPDWIEANQYYLENNFVNNDIQKIIQLSDSEKNKLLLGIIDKNYNQYYKGQMSHTYKYRPNKAKKFKNGDKTDTQFAHLLKESNWLPSSDGHLHKPSELYLYNKENQDLFGNSLPYLSLKVENTELIEILGIHKKPDLESAINHLSCLSENRNEEKDKYEKLYMFIDRCNNNDRKIQYLKEEFENNPLIYINSNNNSVWLTSGEVHWKDESVLFGNEKGYLVNQYPTLRDFFIEKLGITEKASPYDYINLLKEIKENESINKEDEDRIRKIYYYFEDYFNNLIGENRGEEIKEIVEKILYWTNKNVFWNKDDDIFINDNRKLFNMFSQKSSVAFLNIEFNTHQNLSFFIRATGLKFLSESIEIEPESIEGAEKDKNKAEKLRNLLPYVKRYLYAGENDIYKDAKDNGRFGKLLDISCFNADKIVVKYILNQEEEINERRAFYNKDENRIYLQRTSDQSDDNNYLVGEIAGIFESPKGLDDFIGHLLKKESHGQIEKYMESKNIPKLPELEETENNRTESPASLTVQNMEPERINYNIKDESDEIPPDAAEKPADISSSEQAEEVLLPGFPSENLLPEPEPVQQANIPKQLPELSIPFSQPDAAEDNRPQYNQNIPGNSERKSYSSGTGHNHPETKQPPACLDWEPGCRVDDAEVGSIYNIKEIETEKQNFKTGIAWSHSGGENLSVDAKKMIGRWGEEYVMKILTEKYKEKYSDGEIRETPGEFTINKDGKELVRVILQNLKTENNPGYDILLTECGVESQIEVKTTKDESNEAFRLSKTQWKTAKEIGDRFIIYRIFNAGTKNPKALLIPDPYNEWQNGRLFGYPVEVLVSMHLEDIRDKEW